MSEQTQPETALQSLAEKLRTDAIAIFGEGQAERDIIEWFYGALLAAPAHPAERQEHGEVQGLSAWIACCDDHLPPEDQQVLCWCDDGGMTFIEVASQHNGFFTDCFHELLPVTHWMPFPAAPALAAGTEQEVVK